jgi:hypothetical protein
LGQDIFWISERFGGRFLNRLPVQNLQVAILTGLTLVYVDSGVDVMITIFGEKVGVFSKTNVMIQLLHNLALFFDENI